MDKAFYEQWFGGFIEGCAALPDSARQALLGACARKCASSGPLTLYRQAADASGGEPGRFFALLGERDGIDTAELELGRVYEVSYPRCACDLHADGLTDNPCLCECSRQSLLFCLEQTFPAHRFAVTLLQSVLRGDARCRFRVALLAPGEADVRDASCMQAVPSAQADFSPVQVAAPVVFSPVKASRTAESAASSPADAVHAVESKPDTPAATNASPAEAAR